MNGTAPSSWLWREQKIYIWLKVDKIGGIMVVHKAGQVWWAGALHFTVLRVQTYPDLVQKTSSALEQLYSFIQSMLTYINFNGLLSYPRFTWIPVRIARSIDVWIQVNVWPEEIHIDCTAYPWIACHKCPKPSDPSIIQWLHISNILLISLAMHHKHMQLLDPNWHSPWTWQFSSEDIWKKTWTRNDIWCRKLTCQVVFILHSSLAGSSGISLY